MIRAFIAVDLTESVRTAVNGIQNRLRKSGSPVKVSWTKVENLHLTLQFLGSADEKLTGPLSEALAKVAGQHRRFDMTIAGAGAFPNLHQPKVLWVGCDDPDGKLRALARDVQTAMMAFGFVPEQREFTAHLTLGRIKLPRPDAALTVALDSIKKERFGDLPVEVIHLYQSQLHPEGSIYTKLSSHKLTGDTNHVVKS